MNPNALKNLLDILSMSNVQYLIVGGIAVELCGYARATFDLDIIIDHEPGNVQGFLKAVQAFGEGVARELTADDFDLTEGCISINETDLQIDVFTIISGHTYRDLLPFIAYHRPEGSDQAIPYLGAEGLIMLKSQSVRPKDQQDLQALRDLESRNGAKLQ